MEEKYRPLSPWAYFGYNLLFSVPVVGFVFLIIFSFNNKNINRRNYARSFFCGYLLFLVIITAVVLLNVFVLGLNLYDYIEEFRF
jgi:hypothetical protein